VLVVVVRYIFNKSFGEEGNLAQKPAHAMLVVVKPCDDRLASYVVSQDSKILILPSQAES
jgi:hypothetical protein